MEDGAVIIGESETENLRSPLVNFIQKAEAYRGNASSSDPWWSQLKNNIRNISHAICSSVWTFLKPTFWSYFIRFFNFKNDRITLNYCYLFAEYSADRKHIQQVLVYKTIQSLWDDVHITAKMCDSWAVVNIKYVVRFLLSDGDSSDIHFM